MRHTRPSAQGDKTRLVPAIVNLHQQCRQVHGAGAQGYQVRLVGDWAAGLQLAAQEPVDVFILDIGLPGMDGYELARRLRATPGGHAAKLIALTGYGKEQNRVLAMLSGFDHHLVKPVDIAALTKILLRR